MLNVFYIGLLVIINEVNMRLDLIVTLSAIMKRTYSGIHGRRLMIVVVIDRREFLFLQSQEFHGQVQPHGLWAGLAITDCHHATPHL